jgi:hypothetical protein
VRDVGHPVGDHRTRLTRGLLAPNPQGEIHV